MKLSIILFICIFPFLSLSQPHYKNLVFEGGGIRGIAYSGVVQGLEEKGILKNIERVGGTSAGAITALCISLGYHANELEKINEETPYQKFNDGKNIFFGGLHRTNKYFGWYRGNYFLKWIGKIIKEKTGEENCTFKQLHEAKKFKDLYITGTSLTNQKTVYFSYEHTPNMKLKDAVRISMSIPLYFESVFRNPDGEIIYHPKKKDNLEVLADGGFLCNYPIHLFDSTKYLNSNEINQFKPNLQTLGVLLETKKQLEEGYQSNQIVSQQIENIKDYLWAFYTILLEHLNRNQMTEDDWKRTIIVNTENVNPKIKKMSLKDKTILINNGKKGVEEYFK